GCRGAQGSGLGRAPGRADSRHGRARRRQGHLVGHPRAGDRADERPRHLRWREHLDLISWEARPAARNSAWPSRGLSVMRSLCQITNEQGTATVAVTHDIRMIGEVDQVIHLQDGQVMDRLPEPSARLRWPMASEKLSRGRMSPLRNIQACVFDAYGTLFDVHAAVGAYAARVGESADRLSALWRAKQLEYTWLRSLMRRHADFWQVTGDALDFALDSCGITDRELRRELM